MQTGPSPYKPILKPYSGVDASFLERHAVIITGIVGVLFALPYGFLYAATTPWLLVEALVPIGILTVLVVWTLPHVKTAPEATMERLLFGAFIALGVWPGYVAIDLPGLPWITVLRITAIPLSLLILVSLSTTPDYRARLGRVISATPIVYIFVLLLVVAQLFSIPFSHHSGDSISKFTIIQTTQTFLYFACALMFVKPRRVEIWAALFWLCAVIVSIVALFEYMHEQVPWSGRLPKFLSVDPLVEKILAGVSRSTTGQYRAQSIFVTSLNMSEYLAYALPFILHFAASNRYKPFWRLMALATVPLVLLAVLASDSRLGILGFFLAVMFYLFFWAARHRRSQRNSLLGTAVMAAYPALFAVFIVLSLTVGRIKNKVWGTGQYDASNQARIDQTNMAIPKVLTHPLGHGPAEAGTALGFTNPSGEITVDVGYVATAMEYGIFGLIFMYGIFVAAIYYALRYVLFEKAKDHDWTFALPLCLTLVNFLVIKGVLAQEENHPLVFMAAGILTAIVYRARHAAGNLPQPTLARGGTF